MSTSGKVEWREVLDELRHIRRHAARSEDELWEAVDEIRDLLADRSGPGSARTSTASAHGNGRLRPADYRRLKRRLRRFATEHLPEGAPVAVVSRGDAELLELPGARAGHFPRDAHGGYAGFYPADGTAAIAHLEWARASGVQYLLFPATASWWFASFPRLSNHLDSDYRVRAREEGVGVLYDLTPLTANGGSRGTRATLKDLLDAWERAGDAPTLLDWHTGLDLDALLRGRSVFAPPTDDERLPYLDASVSIVALHDGDRGRLAEARRVASRSVVRFLDPVTSNGATPMLGVRTEHVGDAPPNLPTVSIVIPTYNGIAHVEPCLRALDTTLGPAFDGEVLIVDDGSGHETAGALERLQEHHDWLRIVRSPSNQGFISACNRGAEAASCEYLVFLNDDTVPLPGWLDALVRTFEQYADAGAAGGRLIYPDGSLQEAGGVIYRDGSGANLGRGDYDVDAPLYRHVRRVDYCSGALLATPRRLFRDLGGFDTRYRPAYYEDTDYCFRVRAEGLAVYYQPASTVVHTEGATSGTSLGGGVKRHQLHNQKVFRKRWASALRDLPDPPARYSDDTWVRLAMGRRA